MRTRFVIFAVALAVLLTVSVAGAQTPYIAVYFNHYLNQETAVCPGVGVVGTWYVAARNFNAFLSGAEFAIEYPPAVTWMADLNKPAASIGSTPAGISMGFPLPENGFYPVLLCTPQVLWMCDGCMDPYLNNGVKVKANPMTGFLGVTDYPQFNPIPCVGLTAYICATTPVEETTWGQVKSLYGE
jgi:hypothetical protein